jgi:acetyltransferase
VILPPLNARLAHDMIRAQAGSGTCRMPRPHDDAAADALARLLVQLSALACAVPWVRRCCPSNLCASRGGVRNRRRTRRDRPAVGPVTRHYSHMAIHPYPVELVTDVTLARWRAPAHSPDPSGRRGARSAFVATLSEETRYFRFFYQLNELTPSMLARFTQVDYDREMAFVAIDETARCTSIVGVAATSWCRTANPPSSRRRRRRVARPRRRACLMRGLVACAKARGLSRLEGPCCAATGTC